MDTVLANGKCAVCGDYARDCECVSEARGGEVMNELDMESLENDLYVRLGSVTDTRLRVQVADIVEVFSHWLADNYLAIVNDDQDIIEL